MPYSCTVGNCGDCMVRLRSGEVTQNEPNCLTPQQQADGYVLTCVSCPPAEGHPRHRGPVITGWPPLRGHRNRARGR
ncbi:2Fe-2S iron-sulfur cluster-binding protein [Streptomyces sp. NBC_01604]|uniref:2Fe-2S iron-sulfur cluster-binding protein n=1 Tax=Streptomyces sp. NBC_01604 TaxID=2975894 RepID=UPI0038664B9C